MARRSHAITALEIGFALVTGIGIGLLFGSRGPLRAMLRRGQPLTHRRNIDYDVLRQ